jgi:hypothetical protein
VKRRTVREEGRGKREEGRGKREENIRCLNERSDRLLTMRWLNEEH